MFGAYDDYYSSRHDDELLGYLTIIGVLAITCALISGSLAKSKHLDYTTYFCLGLFLGPLGLIVAAAVPKGERPPPPGMAARICPKCTARQNIAATSTEYECWQCKTTTTVQPFITITAGWYTDPDAANQERYWDGQLWTSERRPINKSA